jgi:hypothetical protein
VQRLFLLTALFGGMLLVMSFQNCSMAPVRPNQASEDLLLKVGGSRIMQVTVTHLPTEGCGTVICAYDERAQKQVCYVPSGLDSKVAVGSDIEVTGYFDDNSESPCTVGPVFRIQSTTLMSAKR